MHLHVLCSSKTLAQKTGIFCTTQHHMHLSKEKCAVCELGLSKQYKLNHQKYTLVCYINTHTCECGHGIYISVCNYWEQSIKFTVCVRCGIFWFDACDEVHGWHLHLRNMFEIISRHNVLLTPQIHHTESLCVFLANCFSLKNRSSSSITGLLLSIQHINSLMMWPAIRWGQEKMLPFTSVEPAGIVQKHSSPVKINSTLAVRKTLNKHLVLI